MCYRAIHLSQHYMILHYRGCSLAYLIHNRQPEASVSFIILSKGSDHCDRLSSSRHRLLNFTDMRRTTQRWQNFGRRVGLALIGQEKINLLFFFRVILCVSTSISIMIGKCSKPMYLEGLIYSVTFRMRKKLSCVKNI
jgi:hypothetical protein